MATKIFVFFLISAVTTGSVLGRPSTEGFISIDCGIPEDNSESRDSTTGLIYTSDDKYISTGSNQFVQRLNPDLQTIPVQLQTLRSFHEGVKNCYILPVKKGTKYLVRALFLYGNYDGQNKADTDRNSEIQFDIYLGDNLWEGMKIEQAWSSYKTEVIAVAWDDSVHVCLVNTGTGTPFISALELRPLNYTLYPSVDAFNPLRVAIRRTAPSATQTQIRYPEDPYDRIWEPFLPNTNWTNISTSSNIQLSADDPFAVPSAVLQHAIIPSSNFSLPEIDISWVNQKTLTLLVALHFAELTNSNRSRSFAILYNQQRWWNQSVTPRYLHASSVFNSTPFFSSNGYNFKLIAADKSTLPPILNAMEIFNVMTWQNIGNTTTSRKKKIASVTMVIISVGSLAVLLLLVICGWKLITRKKRRGRKASHHPIMELDDDYPRLDCQRFTYLELETSTKNFSEQIGKGGFGIVYRGCLDNGALVAVKVLSQSSSQGINEFLAEAQFLTRIHHRHLVSFIGYCKDENCLALVYEYMSRGSLQDCLRAKDHGLSWRQRLRIALEAAQGLEYLHSGCIPAIIHRDVKSSNILLTENLEVKIADLGMSKSFPKDELTHLTTKVIGTHGYLDPEYYRNNQLTEKSDVYSFGVVLLELITGQSAIRMPEKTHIAEWVMSEISRGDISQVIDSKLQGKYNPNSAWKIVDIAIPCTASSSINRPTMADVVVQLKEALQLVGTVYGDTTSISTGEHNRSQHGLYGESDPILLTIPSLR